MMHFMAIHVLDIFKKHNDGTRNPRVFNLKRTVHEKFALSFVIPAVVLA